MTIRAVAVFAHFLHNFLHNFFCTIFCTVEKRWRRQLRHTMTPIQKLMIFGYNKNCMKRSSKNKLFTNSNKSDMFYSLLLDWMQSFVWVNDRNDWGGGKKKTGGNWLTDWLRSIFIQSINQLDGRSGRFWLCIYFDICVEREMKIKVF